MRNKFLKTGACALAACLAMTGCSKVLITEAFDASDVVMTVNDEEVSAGTVKFALHYSQVMYQETYEYYFGENPFSYEYIDGYSIGDMMVDSTVELIQEMVLARQHMDEYGVELTEDEESAITEAAAAFIEANDTETLEAISATQESVEEYLTLATIQQKMEAEPMIEDVDTDISDEEAAQRRVEYVYVAAETEEESEAETEINTESESEVETAYLTGNTAVKTTSSEETEESDTETETETETETDTETETEDPETAAAMAEAYAKAEEILDLVQDGASLTDAAAEIDEALSVTELTFGSDSTAVEEALITATDGLSDDTLVEYPVEGEAGYYVVHVIYELDEDATEEEKESILSERQEEAIEELYAEWEEESTIDIDDEVLATITIDVNLYPYEETETESETEPVSEAESEYDTEAESESEFLTEISESES